MHHGPDQRISRAQYISQITLSLHKQFFLSLHLGKLFHLVQIFGRLKVEPNNSIKEGKEINLHACI